MASRVGKYLLFETLGEGAFGKVKLGVHEETGEQVAVKIMDKSDIRAQEMTMNVRREIAIMKALKHRNIVNLRQVLTSQSKLYIVMELVTGGELFTKILKEGKLEEKVARRYFQQLVDGIDYCHMRGVCHRDLKPENLLIDETTGELKITDFGLSAMKGASTTTDLLHTQCGSPNYCAPEIIARHKQGYSGAKVDAWSCGIILFALLAGYLPFYDENTKALYRSIQRDEAKFPKKFPPEAKDLVTRLLHKDPDQRITLMDVKRHSWFAVDYEGDGARDSVPKKKGHRRKPSMDHAPRSRDLGTRKKSDKSDTDSAVLSTTSMPPPVPPPVVQPQAPPLPPPVVSPMQRPPPPPAHRPPGPPPIAAPGMPQLPPRIQVPPQPIYPPTSMDVQPSVSPPPVVPPPVVPSSPHMQRTSPVPPVPPAVTHYASRQPAANPSPPHRSKPTSPVTMLPPMESYDVQGRSAPIHDKLPVPPPPIRDPQVNAHRPYDSSRQSSNLSASSPPSNQMNNVNLPATQASNEYYNAVPHIVPPTNQQPVPNAVTPAPNAISAPGAMNIPTTTGQAPSSSPKPSRPKWTVSGPTYTPSTISSETHVITPSSLANGDASWQKFNNNYAFELSNSKPNTQPNENRPVVKDSTSYEVPDKPLSTVERKAMLFNDLASRSDMPPPVPDMSHTAKFESKRIMDPQSEPTITPMFEDRPEVSTMTRYPAAAQAQLGTSNGNVSGASFNPQIPVAATSNTHETKKIDQGSTENGASIPADAGDEMNVAPLRQRLAAAVARYRRIFKLGNNIGITASPSFSSNKGPLPSAHEIESKGGRTDFFARAKAVTGAWGIILTQELEEDSDSEDEITQVTEAELQAFSKLLDFWDNRRASATMVNGGEVILDDENTSPLTEADIQSIQSLLQKLEPKQVEEEMEEVTEVEPSVGDTVPNLPSPVDGTFTDTSNVTSTSSQNRSATGSLPHQNGHGSYPPSASGGSNVSGINNMPDRAPPLPGIPEFSDVSNSEVSHTELSGNPYSTSPSHDRPPVAPIVPASSIPQPPAPPTFSVIPPPAPPQAATRAGPPPPPPPPPPVNVPQFHTTANKAPPPPPPPPAYAAPEGAVDSGSRRMPVTQSTLLDPYRPQPPPSYAPPNLPKINDRKDSGTEDQVKKDSGASSDKPPKGSPRDSNDVAKKNARRSSSTNKSDADIKPSKNLSRDSVPKLSAASDGSGSGSKRHNRAPSRDEHATFGLFRFGLLTRRKSSSLTTFETQLPLDKCVLELARVLDSMKCKVMLKKDDTKMKCETNVKGEKLLVSITCTKEKKITTVQFKKGRRDKSNLDQKDFFEFFQAVHSRFTQRTSSES